MALAIAPALGHREQLGAGASDTAAIVAEEPVGHLVISEVMTGGASASDEFAELYNPTPAALPLEGLEVVYVTASGTTITRKASWSAGAPSIPPGAHVLIANAAGIFATIADATYPNGIAAAGGSFALRIQGAASAIDSVGWGNATSSWIEGTPAAAPPAGSSIERLPGGAEGSAQDTDSNVVDFALRAVPDPQNSTSPPVPIASASPTATPVSSESPNPSSTATDTPTPSPTPSGTPSATPADSPSSTPTPTPSATPTPSPTPSPSPTPNASPLSIADARALPDGAAATIAGIALTASDFTDGGGCVTDETAGIAVLVDAGTFARGARVQATGTVDDRYAQRTLRVPGDGLESLGAGAEPPPLTVPTGSIGESTECALVQVTGVIAGAPTSLTSGLAFEIDDGSGPIRILVSPASGIDASDWAKDATLTVIGVAGQRDSSGTGTSGYRVLPRDPMDVVGVSPAPTPTPTSTPTLSPTPTPAPSASDPTPTPSATPAPGLMSIAQARAAATGTAVHLRGTVTLGTGLVDAPTAVIQDTSAAIVLRLGDDTAGATLRRGAYIDVTGIRSTKSGMVTIRVDAITTLGTQAEPAATRVTTGAATERFEARLLVARGAVATTPLKSTAGNVAFSIDDGSGPLRITLLSAAQVATTSLVKGAWLEVTGVLGQQTSGSQPDRGYRLWPRDNEDMQVISGAVASNANDGAGAQGPVKATSHTPPGQLAKRALIDAVDAGARGAVPPGPAGGPITGSSAAGPDKADGPASASEVELAAAHHDPRLGLGLLSGASAGGILFATLGWRGGTLQRLRAVLPQLLGRNVAPADGLGVADVASGGFVPAGLSQQTETNGEPDSASRIGPVQW